MRLFFLLILGLVTQISAHAAPDEIDKAIAEGLPKSSLSWLNGIYQPLDLPSDATPYTIVDKIAQQSGYKDRYGTAPFDNYWIAGVKKVTFPDAPGPYTAILIISGKGSKTLILAQYNNNKALGWWHRSFHITTVP